MILVRKERVKRYLKEIRRSQAWLAQRMGIKPAYLSRIVNNDCKISNPVIERLLIITGYQFEHLFYIDGKKDKRMFFACREIFDGESVITYQTYENEINEKILLDNSV